MKEEEIEQMLAGKNLKKKYQVLKSLDEEAAFDNFCKRVRVDKPAQKKQGKVFTMRRMWTAVAAIVVIAVLCAGVISYMNQGPSTEEYVASIQPGGSQAYLTTSNGKSVQLGSAAQSIKEDGIQASAKDGELDIQDGDEATMNKLTIPRCGEFKVTLPDGTKVHLNAESTLEFPGHFTGNIREVKLTGEAYFDVAHSSDKPFVVKVGNAEVKQYGTHYNINAYHAGNIQVTLVEGSISVKTAKSSEKMLTSGHQAVVSGEDISIRTVDVNKYVGWNDGIFCFEDERLEDIASTLTRWYDADIEADASLANMHFTGSLMRNDNLEDILDAICELTGTTYEYRNNVIKLHRK